MSQHTRRERTGACPSAARLVRGTVAFSLVLGGLAACSGPASINPVDWWHNLEGGQIAGQRPPPPKADAPYPNLSTVPAKPALSGPAQRQAIASGLVADRTNAQYAASLTPLVPTAPVPPSPPSAAAASASLPAASAPTPAPAPASETPPPPRKAPRGAVTQSDLPAPAPAAPPAANPPAATPADQETPADLPAAPPPPPRIEGVAVPQVTVPTPPPPAPPAAPAAPPAVTSNPAGVGLIFAAASSELPAGAEEALRAFAARNRTHSMVVSAGGDGSGSPDAQGVALPLALARTRAISSVLIADGVPASLIGIDASAEGHSGAVRIAN